MMLPATGMPMHPNFMNNFAAAPFYHPYQGCNHEICKITQFWQFQIHKNICLLLNFRWLTDFQCDARQTGFETKDTKDTKDTEDITKFKDTEDAKFSSKTIICSKTNIRTKQERFTVDQNSKTYT